MTGDTEDFLQRLRAVLPSRWFPDQSPVLDGVLKGLASAWAWLYDTLSFVRAQARIGTAFGIWLDVIAADFFGPRLKRRPAQSDDDFRASIRRELVRERGTRAAVSAALSDLTGRAPVIFEPARTSDTGGYGGLRGGGGGIGYGVAGGWGSLGLPFQFFVAAYRPHGTGIAAVAGWNASTGAYGVGALEYASLLMITGQVTDSDIFASVAAVLPVNTIAWVQIRN